MFYICNSRVWKESVKEFSFRLISSRKCRANFIMYIILHYQNEGDGKRPKRGFGRILQIDHSFKVSRNMLFYRESSTILTRGHGESSQNMIKDKKSLSCGFYPSLSNELIRMHQKRPSLYKPEEIGPLVVPYFLHLVW